MGMLAKSVIYGAVAGSAWISARAIPVFLEWRTELSSRVEVVSYARDVPAGQKLAADDLRTTLIATDLADGSAARQVSACVGRTARCAAKAGAVVVRGCLGKDE